MKIIANFIEDKNGKFHNLKYVVSFTAEYRHELKKFAIFVEETTGCFLLPTTYDTQEEATKALISLLGAIEYNNQPKFETNSLC